MVAATHLNVSRTCLETLMTDNLARPRADIEPNTLEYETTPLVKATGFREYDARWLFGPEINLLGIQALGQGLGTLFREMAKSLRSSSAMTSAAIRFPSNRP